MPGRGIGSLPAAAAAGKHVAASPRGRKTGLSGIELQASRAAHRGSRPGSSSGSVPSPSMVVGNASGAGPWQSGGTAGPGAGAGPASRTTGSRSTSSPAMGYVSPSTGWSSKTSLSSRSRSRRSRSRHRRHSAVHGTCTVPLTVTAVDRLEDGVDHQVGVLGTWAPVTGAPAAVRRLHVALRAGPAAQLHDPDPQAGRVIAATRDPGRRTPEPPGCRPRRRSAGGSHRRGRRPGASRARPTVFIVRSSTISKLASLWSQ